MPSGPMASHFFFQGETTGSIWPQYSSDSRIKGTLSSLDTQLEVLLGKGAIGFSLYDVCSNGQLASRKWPYTMGRYWLRDYWCKAVSSAWVGINVTYTVALKSVALINHCQSSPKQSCVREGIHVHCGRPQQRSCRVYIHEMQTNKPSLRRCRRVRESEHRRKLRA